LTFRFQRSSDHTCLGVIAGQRQRRLVAVLGLPRYAVQHQGPAGGCFRVPVRNRQPRVQAPPVVDQHNDPGHDLTALVILRRESRPAHWFFNSSNTFSASARSRYNCATPSTASVSEVTNTAYS
jgi:hypothetical protein